jgi:hypothetical protein
VGKNNGEHASLSETVGSFKRVFDAGGDSGGMLKHREALLMVFKASEVDLNPLKPSNFIKFV